MPQRNPDGGGAPVADVVVVGAICLDVKGRVPVGSVPATSNSGVVRVSAGGCGRNMAENLARLGTSVTLFSAVCGDDFGRTLVTQTERAGVNVEHVIFDCELHSATYIALLGEHGQLLMGVDDTRIIGVLTPRFIRERAALLAGARMVLIDANLSLESAAALLEICAAAAVPVALAPVALEPALRYRPLLGSFSMVVPNRVEAEALTGLTIGDTEQAVRAAQQLVACGVQIAIVTLGERGLVYATPSLSGHVPAIDIEVQDPTGAGDALTATVVYALLNTIPIDEAVRLGVSAATLTLDSVETVRPDLSLESLYAQLVI